VRSEFRDLAAYQRSVVLARDLRQEIRRWSSFDRWSIGIQMIRAIDSVGANIAEASGRLHVLDRRRFLLNARGSLHETEHWILTAQEAALLAPETMDRLEGIARPLAGLISRHAPD
jgi:four helix bundle protein